MRALLLFTLSLSTACNNDPESIDTGTVENDNEIPADTGEPDDLIPAEGCWSVSDSYLFGTPPTGSLTSDVDGPIPTNDWWTSLIWNCLEWGNDYSTDMHAQPLVFKADANGLHLHYADRPTTANSTDTRFAVPGDYDLHIGLSDLNASATTLVAHSDWTVTAGWSDETNEMTATMGRGMPFAYFETDGAFNVTLNGSWSILTQTEDSIVIDGSDGRIYGFYALPGSTWASDDSGFHVQSNYLAVGALPAQDENTLNLFTTHAYARPIDTQVAWTYNEDSAILETQFVVTTEVMNEGATAVPLLALYPHQWRATDADLLDLQFNTARGQMKLIAASEFRTEYTFHGLLPGLPLMPDTDTELLANLLADEDTDSINTTSDTYNGGKGIARVASTLHLAQLLGDEDAANTARDKIQESLEQWFSADGDSTPLFAYNDEWTTLVGFPAAYGSDSELNDHHFHWSYFLHGAAAVALANPTWAEDDQWGGMVKMLIRDAANPNRDDPAFPFLRNFDPYAGHSWANGHAGFPDGNNQESSSEAVFFASGLISYGEAIGNTTIRDLGIYIYTTEVAAIQDYWFDVHDETWTDNYQHETAGIVWGSGVAYGTWFSGEPEMKLGIQYLPIHAGSLHLGLSPQVLDDQYDEVLSENGGPPDVWAGLLWSGLAAGNGDRAWSLLEPELNTYEVEAGETRAFTYHWIRTLAELGQVDAQITANIPTYAVFNGEIGTTYVAFNSGCDNRRVTFSDGTELNVGARQLTAVREGQEIDTWTLGSCVEEDNDECVDIEEELPLYYLTMNDLSTERPTELDQATVPGHDDYYVNTQPTDPSLILSRSAFNVTGSYTGEDVLLNIVADSQGVGQAVQAKLRIDLDADGTYDREEMVGYWAIDAAIDSWETFTNHQLVSETGTWGDLDDATVTLELWSSFGGEDVHVRVGDSWILLPISP